MLFAVWVQRFNFTFPEFTRRHKTAANEHD
jgi:hypothetical protein